MRLLSPLLACFTITLSSARKGQNCLKCAPQNKVQPNSQLEAYFTSRWTVHEDFGAHPYTRKKGSQEPHSRGDTVKAAVTDCIKRCSRQIGVGLELYCDDDSYHSFERIKKERRRLAPGSLSILPPQPVDFNLQPNSEETVQ